MSSMQPAEVPEGYERIQPGFITFDMPGQSLEGEYLGAEPVRFGESTVDRHSLDIGGEMMQFLGSTTIDNLLKQVNVGDVIRVTYTGDGKTSSGRKLKEWVLLRKTK